jgi:hypothetical protein
MRKPALSTRPRRASRAAKSQRTAPIGSGEVAERVRVRDDPERDRARASGGQRQHLPSREDADGDDEQHRDEKIRDERHRDGPAREAVEGAVEPELERTGLHERVCIRVEPRAGEHRLPGHAVDPEVVPGPAVGRPNGRDGGRREEHRGDDLEPSGPWDTHPRP